MTKDQAPASTAARGGGGGQSRKTPDNQHNAARRSGPDDQMIQRTTTPKSTKEKARAHINARRTTSQSNDRAASAIETRQATRTTAQHDSTTNKTAPAHQHSGEKKNAEEEPTPDRDTAQQDPGNRKTPRAAARRGGHSTNTQSTHHTQGRMEGIKMKPSQAAPRPRAPKGGNHRTAEKQKRKREKR